MGYAHQQGVVHRDLKPSNILVTSDGRPVVTDFGLALGESETRRLTESGAVLGTLHYMAPEQVLGNLRQIGAPTDVWALGVMLYELLTGAPPFPGATVAQVYRLILGAEPAAPRRRASSVGRDLETVCLKALEKVAGRRYATADLLADDLRRVRRGELILAAPPSRLYRVRRWIGRHRTLCAAAGVVALLALLMLWVHRWRVRSDLERRTARVVAEARRLHDSLAQALRGIERLDGPQARALTLPNGELDRPAVAAWFRRHEEAVRILDRISALHEQAPTAPARRAVGRSGADRRRAVVCRRAWRKAARLGDETLARSWIGRAELDRTARATAIRWLEQVRQARAEAVRGQARELLREARQPVRSRAEWFEFSLNGLVRLKDPVLVRLLLSKQHLDSPHAWERRLAIEALGRLGDTRTTGPDGADPVEALAARLARIDPEEERETAVSLARALGLLGDVRAYDALDHKRRRAGADSAFWARTAVPFARLPLPARYRVDGPPPKTARAFFERGRARKQKGDWRGALDDYTQAIALEAGHYQAYLLRGTVRMEIGELPAARADLDRAIAIDPAGPEAYRVRAAVHEKQGEGAAALADYDRAIARNPRYVQAHMGRGIVRAEMGDPRGAQRDFDRAIELAPRNPLGYFNRSEVRRRLGDLTGALADSNRALRLDRYDADYYTGRAAVRMSRKEWDQALADYNRAIKLDPRLVPAYIGRGILRERVRKDVEAALADFTRAIRIAPRNYRGHYYRGAARQKKGDLPGAIQDLTRAIKLAPNQHLPWYVRGLARRDGGDSTRELADLRKAVELAPAFWHAREAYGRALARLGQQAEALAALREALRWAPPPRRPPIQALIDKLSGKTR